MESIAVLTKKHSRASERKEKWRKCKFHAQIRWYFCDACYLCKDTITSSDYTTLSKFMTVYRDLYMVQIMNIWQEDFKHRNVKWIFKKWYSTTIILGSTQASASYARTASKTWMHVRTFVCDINRTECVSWNATCDRAVPYTHIMSWDDPWNEKFTF
jgi:hypothetical protein